MNGLPYRSVLLTVASIALASSSPASAQTADPPTAPIRWIERCADSPVDSEVTREQALQLLVVRPEARALDALDTAIHDRHVPVAELRSRLIALLGMPCFEAAELDARTMPPPFRSRLAAEAWWVEGGRRWLEQFVGRRDFSAVWVFPPSERPSLTRDALDPTDPLHDLACPDGPARCATESLAWSVRLRASFDAVEFDPSFIGVFGGAEGQPGDTGQRFIDWHDYVEAARGTRFALPVGALEVPRSGWLVVRNGIDELVAVDIVRGAAHVARRSGDERAEVQVMRGMVDVNAVRELTWAMAMLSRMNRGHLPLVSAALPEGVRARFTNMTHQIVVDTCRDPGAGRDYSMEWRDETVVRAEYHWAHAPNAERHLLALLDSVLAGIQSACLRARPRAEVVARHGWQAPPHLELEAAILGVDSAGCR